MISDPIQGKDLRLIQGVGTTKKQKRSDDHWLWIAAVTLIDQLQFEKLLGSLITISPEMHDLGHCRGQSILQF